MYLWRIPCLTQLLAKWPTWPTPPLKGRFVRVNSARIPWYPKFSSHYETAEWWSSKQFTLLLNYSGRLICYCRILRSSALGLYVVILKATGTALISFARRLLLCAWMIKVSIIIDIKIRITLYSVAVVFICVCILFDIRGRSKNISYIIKMGLCLVELNYKDICTDNACN
jgi:hypothetical protein